MNKDTEAIRAESTGSKEEAGERDDFRRESSQSDAIFLAELSVSRQATKPGKSVGALALREFHNPSADIFDVKSGQFKGMDVPEPLRCAIFQSNIAVKAGIIKPGEVTIRALEFENTLKKHGYKPESFDPSKSSYPDGTYIIGEGARDGTNSRHVSLVFGGKLIHTKDGAIVNEPISNKFFPGAYDRMTVLQAKPQKKASR